VVNFPYNSLGPLFKGRDTALIELRQGLTAGEGRAVGLTARQAIHGLGGVDALLFVSGRCPVDLRANLAELWSPLVLNLPEWNQLEEIVRPTGLYCLLFKFTPLLSSSDFHSAEHILE